MKILHSLTLDKYVQERRYIQADSNIFSLIEPNKDPSVTFCTTICYKVFENTNLEQELLNIKNNFDVEIITYDLDKYSDILTVEFNSPKIQNIYNITKNLE